jgi:two-component sensor histidine kinase
MINELVTNAFKYAYPPGAQGDIRISLKRTPEGGVLTVTDKGVGFSKDNPSQGTGLGGKILRAMATSVGSLDYPAVDKGATAVITFKP